MLQCQRPLLVGARGKAQIRIGGPGLVAGEGQFSAAAIGARAMLPRAGADSQPQALAPMVPAGVHLQALSHRGRVHADSERILGMCPTYVPGPVTDHVDNTAHRIGPQVPRPGAAAHLDPGQGLRVDERQVLIGRVAQKAKIQPHAIDTVQDFRPFQAADDGNALAGRCLLQKDTGHGFQHLREDAGTAVLKIGGIQAHGVADCANARGDC